MIVYLICSKAYAEADRRSGETIMDNEELTKAYQQLFTDAALKANKPDYFLHLSNHFHQMIQNGEIGEAEYWLCVSIVENLKAADQITAAARLQQQLFALFGKILMSGVLDALAKKG